MSRHKLWVALVLFLMPAMAPGQSVKGPTSAKLPEPQTDQTTNIPYYTLHDGMDSTLTLNNVAPTSTKATVTIFNSEGRAQVLDPVTLDPHSYKQIELRDVIKGEDFGSGNVEVAFKGISMAVTA
jgi:hypothetical protein